MSEPWIIEWHRVDSRRALYRAWAVGASFVVVGAAATSVVFSRLGTTWDPSVFALTIAGLAVTVFGMFVMIRASMRVLTDERCLVVRSDGVRFDRAGAEGTVLPWERIDCVTVDEASDALWIKTDGQAGAEDLRLALRFNDIDNRALAEQLMATRRKVLMGIVVRPTPTR